MRLLPAFTLLFAFPLLSQSSHARWFDLTDVAMGTEISARFWLDESVLTSTASQNAQAAELKTGIMQIMHATDEGMSPYKADSEIFTLNEQAAEQAVTVSPALFSLLEKSQQYAEASNGAFDITFASAGHLYNYREGNRPADSALRQTLPAIDYRHVTLDRETKTVRFIQPGVKIDLGGIAKGYAVDNAIEYLANNGVKHAYVAAGGDTRVLGNKGSSPWYFGIQHPRKEGEHAVVIPVEDIAISTSGDYERYFLDGDERVHHIINPKTGQSASDVQSATVMTKQAVDADALSTTVFVLGVRKGLALINRLPATDAIIIDNQGKLHYSDDLLLQEQRQESSQ